MLRCEYTKHETQWSDKKHNERQHHVFIARALSEITGEYANSSISSPCHFHIPRISSLFSKLCLAAVGWGGEGPGTVGHNMNMRNAGYINFFITSSHKFLRGSVKVIGSANHSCNCIGMVHLKDNLSRKILLETYPYK